MHRFDRVNIQELYVESTDTTDCEPTAVPTHLKRCIAWVRLSSDEVRRERPSPKTWHGGPEDILGHNVVLLLVSNTIGFGDHFTLRIPWPSDGPVDCGLYDGIGVDVWDNANLEMRGELRVYECGRTIIINVPLHQVRWLIRRILTVSLVAIKPNFIPKY